MVHGSSGGGGASGLGQVSSVCSQVDLSPPPPLHMKSLHQRSANHEVHVKQRLTNYRQWLYQQCLNCAQNIGRRKKAAVAVVAAMSSAEHEAGAAAADGESEVKQYWGPLVGHGDNGPSAKPLFSTFRVEGHVTSTCLWHACRAVTIGSLLIVMGMTMAVLGKLLLSSSLDKHLLSYPIIFIF